MAWIRLTLPAPEPVMLLTPGPPPPPEPPLEILVPNPVTTDPRKRVFAFEEDRGEWVLRIVWDSDDPTVLEAEYRAPIYSKRLAKEEIPGFWQAVKEKVSVLGPLPVEAADPRP
ncbi:MAG: hypothetical protein ACHQ2Y_08920 [Candidatus Lutacidiplasmatales archaeon]